MLLVVCQMQHPGKHFVKMAVLHAQIVDDTSDCVKFVELLLLFNGVAGFEQLPSDESEQFESSKLG